MKTLVSFLCFATVAASLPFIYINPDICGALVISSIVFGTIFLVLLIKEAGESERLYKGLKKGICDVCGKEKMVEEEFLITQSHLICLKCKGMDYICGNCGRQYASEVIKPNPCCACGMWPLTPVSVLECYENPASSCGGCLPPHQYPGPI